MSERTQGFVVENAASKMLVFVSVQTFLVFARENNLNTFLLKIGFKIIIVIIL